MTVSLSCNVISLKVYDLICLILVTLEDLSLLNDQDPEITPGLFQGDMVCKSKHSIELMLY